MKTKRLDITPMTYAELKEYVDSGSGSIVSGSDLEYVYEYHLNPMLKAKEEDKIFNTFWLATKENKVIGEAGFKGVVNELGEIELGYFVNEQYRNNGYATEIAGALTEWALRQEGVRYVLAAVGVGNIASVKVLIKCGYLYWGEKNNASIFYKN